MKDNEEQLAKAIGSVIKGLRLEKNYSQEKLAELSGLDMTYISMVERGKRNITIKSLLSICIALEIEMGQLISYVEEHFHYPF